MPASEITAPIADVEFDNGLIAEKVGICRFDAVVDEKVLEDIRSRAASAGYSVIYVMSAVPVPEIESAMLGNVVEFRGSRDAVMASLERFPSKFQIRNMEPSDWSEIEKLYEHSSPTRFSLDPKIGEARARAHKMQCLRAYHERFRKFFSVALNSQQNIIGFQVCLPRQEEIDLYEAVVLPQYRIGFAAADLLRHNLLWSVKDCPDKSNLVTRIYGDNVVSTNFHEKLGMVKSQGDYFYHLWINQG